MNEQTLYIKNLLAKELTSRTAYSSWVFVSLASLLLYVDPNPSGYGEELILSIIVITNVIRGFAAVRNSKKEVLANSKDFLVIKVLTVLTSLQWLTFFVFTTQEVYLKDQKFTLLFSVALFFNLGGVVILSPYKNIGKFFLTCVSVPYIVACMTNFYLQDSAMNFYVGFVLLICYVSGLVMTNKQSELLINLYTNEFKLKESLWQLSDSQKQLMSQTEKLVHSSRLASLGEMSGGVAHEINNPLAVISGYAEKLLIVSEKGDKVDPEMLKRNVTKVLSATERIVKIVKGLKQFSREAEREPFHVTSFKQVLDETMDLCHEKLIKKGTILIVSGKNDFFIDCRSVQISQILINLIMNASQELEKNDMDNKIELNLSENSGFHLISVLNAGPPLSKEIKEKLFQPFFTTKEVGSGTGLGLSISLGLAQSHGGDLRIIDNPKMIEFQLSIPKVSERKVG